MTIIKTFQDKKVLEKKKKDETVMILPLDENIPEERTLHIAYVPSPQSKQLVMVFLLIIAMLVLSAGVIGGIYLYKYIAHAHKPSKVTVTYVVDTAVSTLAPDAPRALPEHSYSTMEEVIDVNEKEDLEKIEVPQFDECRQSLIMHDFNKNYTVIVDKDDSECFIMDLDRNEMSPPKSFAELIRRYASGYYMPKVEVVRRDYRVVMPALLNIAFAGPAIELECLGFDSYKLQKLDLADLENKVRSSMKMYGYSNLQTVIKDQIFK